MSVVDAFLAAILDGLPRTLFVPAADVVQAGSFVAASGADRWVTVEPHWRAFGDWYLVDDPAAATTAPPARAVTKAADIGDEVMVAAVIEAARLRGHASATRWDVATVLAGYPALVGTGYATTEWPGWPPKVILAKAKRLTRRGVLDGCACGCRGDWEPTGPTVTERALELAGGGRVDYRAAWRQATSEMWDRGRADVVAALAVDKAVAAGVITPAERPAAEAEAVSRAAEHIGDLLADAAAAGTDLVGYVNDRLDAGLAARDRGLPTGGADA